MPIINAGFESPDPREPDASLELAILIPYSFIVTRTLVPLRISMLSPSIYMFSASALPIVVVSP